jgi:hypothetical protein
VTAGTGVLGTALEALAAQKIDPKAYIPDFMVPLRTTGGYKKLTPEYLKSVGFHEIKPVEQDLDKLMPGKESIERRFIQGDNQISIYFNRCNDTTSRAATVINGKTTSWGDETNDGIYEQVYAGEKAINVSHKDYGIQALPRLVAQVKPYKTRTVLFDDTGKREIIERAYKNNNYKVRTYEFTNGRVFRFRWSNRKTGDVAWGTDLEGDGNFDQISIKLAGHKVDFKQYRV